MKNFVYGLVFIGCFAQCIVAMEEDETLKELTEQKNNLIVKFLKKDNLIKGYENWLDACPEATSRVKNFDKKLKKLKEQRADLEMNIKITNVLIDSVQQINEILEDAYQQIKKEVDEMFEDAYKTKDNK
ncbi:MAG: hypothetical protein ACXWL2_04740 [Candidatus Chromulinivorax sp.]